MGLSKGPLSNAGTHLRVVGCLAVALRKWGWISVPRAALGFTAHCCSAEGVCRDPHGAHSELYTGVCSVLAPKPAAPCRGQAAAGGPGVF